MKPITESERRLIKEQYRKAVDDLNKIGEREINRAISRAGITYPPEMLPEAEDPSTAIVIVDGIPFQ